MKHSELFRKVAILIPISVSLNAGTLAKQHTVCPNVTEDARLLLTSVQTLKDGLKKSPECQPVADKITLMTKVLNDRKWIDVKDSLKTGEKTSLEAKDITRLSGLANEVAYALSESVSLLGGSSGNCIQGNKASFLSTLSTITKEVSTVVSNVAGPYEMPVTLVGNLLSSTISGVDKLFKQGKVYDFSRPEEELLFINQFCAFSQAQEEITNFLNLEQKEVDLKNLEVEYLSKIKIPALVENCPECRAYKIAWDAKGQTDRIVGRIIEDANIIDVNLNPSERSTFTRCAEINRAVYSDNSDLKQFITALKDYRNPMMSPSDSKQIQSMVLAMENLSDIYPNYHDCIRMDNQAISIKFNDFIRDEILKMNETIFGQQMSTFQFLANKKYRDPNGNYIAESLDRVKWAQREREVAIRKVQEPNYLMSKQLVIEQQSEYKERLYEELTPKYLKHRFKSNKKNIDQFLKNFNAFKTRELRYFSQRLNKTVTTLPELALELRQNQTLARYFVSSYERIFSDSQVIILEGSNNKRYCDYLLYVKGMVPENRKICDQRIADLDAAMKEHSAFDVDLKTIFEFDAWAVQHLKIQSTYVKNYAERIREWNDRGDSRWKEK